MTAIPSIACLAVIGKNNNPLHIAHFPSAEPQLPQSTQQKQQPEQKNHKKLLLTPLQTSLILSATLDIFQARATANQSAGAGLVGDYGLLHAIDERLAAYGFETNTDVRFVAIVDLRGRLISSDAMTGAATAAPSAATSLGSLGLRDGELKVVFKSMQSAYIRLLQNPFFDPDEYLLNEGNSGKRITSPKFVEEIRRIGESWMPEGLSSVKEKMKR
ncbi:hypothetical protein EPUL_006348 [Erysiphe pulchra]|uniref:Sedlin n=1 Tax=Erysiphe pulchra TaxID=225359 RepID=A0A2S4PL64_9PEZI|nr:hypothetical protein EPUL_006348 [Erysiphe pulchra]